MNEELNLDHFDLGTFVDYVYALKQERDALRARLPSQGGEAVGEYTCGKYAGLPWDEIQWANGKPPANGTKLYTHPASPAADAGLIEALCKVEQALDLIGGIRHGKNVTQDELWQSCELLDAALAAHRANGVV